jgi:large-conductance mechanosensitive channel|tara:strand:+ start:38 stop:289 length:252 start_codon:yes stop_codon:yes gene_type:complete
MKGNTVLIYQEIKTTIFQLIPYALLALLLVLFAQNQEEMSQQSLNKIREDIQNQTEVLAAIRDNLRDSGLAVPPFRTGGTAND